VDVDITDSEPVTSRTTSTPLPSRARHASGTFGWIVAAGRTPAAASLPAAVTGGARQGLEAGERGAPAGATSGLPTDLAVIDGSEGSSLRTGPIAFAPAALGRASRWLPRYVLVLMCLDSLALVVGGLLGSQVRFDTISGDVNGISYGPLLAASVPMWLLILAGSRAYERRYLGLGSEEYRRVANAAVRFTAGFAVVVFAVKWDIARGLVALVLPTSAVLAVAFRYLARQVLHRVRAVGSASHRVLVVGDGRSRDALVSRLEASPHCGLRVVGVCRPVMTGPGGEACVDHVRRVMESVRADTVAVAHSPGLTPQHLRRLAWTLEGTGADLLVAPALTDVAGPRVNIRPVSGLPLLQVAEPEFSGVRRLVKGSIDIVCAAFLALLLLPVLVVIAAFVRASGEGPVLFAQTRIGRDGTPFRMLKFRSMRVDAEARLEELRGLNDHDDGVMFKMRDDPRVTGVGRRLRRYSLDELPQLLNVLRGQMSLVGPRPPLPTEVARYGPDAHRRLLVKPGMTGLWQISGRSDLTWEESVRLDLYYVENWSVALDIEILWKTASAVIAGSGAR
jgi:exopolysaccharide biosynthesis polyprenyl glycosylphosphotransferase